MTEPLIFQTSYRTTYTGSKIDRDSMIRAMDAVTGTINKRLGLIIANTVEPPRLFGLLAPVTIIANQRTLDWMIEQIWIKEPLVKLDGKMKFLGLDLLRFQVSAFMQDGIAMAYGSSRSYSLEAPDCKIIKLDGFPEPKPLPRIARSIVSILKSHGWRWENGMETFRRGDHVLSARSIEKLAAMGRYGRAMIRRIVKP